MVKQRPTCWGGLRRDTKKRLNSRGIDLLPDRHFIRSGWQGRFLMRISDNAAKQFKKMLGSNHHEKESGSPNCLALIRDNVKGLRAVDRDFAYPTDSDSEYLIRYLRIPRLSSIK